MQGIAKVENDDWPTEDPESLEGMLERPTSDEASDDGSPTHCTLNDDSGTDGSNASSSDSTSTATGLVPYLGDTTEDSDEEVQESGESDTWKY